MAYISLYIEKGMSTSFEKKIHQEEQVRSLSALISFFSIFLNKILLFILYTNPVSTLSPSPALYLPPSKPQSTPQRW